MEERRKSKRLELNSKLVLKRLDNGDGKEVGIEVYDLSKSGVGFRCDTPLLIGSVYEGYLTIWTKEVLHAFVEIVRSEKDGDLFNYGAIFVGMPGTDAGRIQTYQTIQETLNK